jgi:hypothetical protein
MRHLFGQSIVLIVAVGGLLAQTQPRQLSCVLIPTINRASSVQASEGKFKEVLLDSMRESRFCAVQELTDNPEPDTLFILSSISKANRFDIQGPILNGRRLNQANFDVTAQVSIVNLTAGEVTYQRSVVGESQFDGVPSAADTEAYFQKAALGALREAANRLVSEYHPGTEYGKVVRSTSTAVMVSVGRKNGIGLQRLEVIGNDGRLLGLLRVRIAEAAYSVCSLEFGEAPEGAAVRSVGVNSHTSGIKPRYAILPIDLPESLVRLGIDGSRAADSLQSSLFSANSLSMLSPIYNDDLLKGQDVLERKTSFNTLDVKNRREQPDGFIEAKVTEASVGRQQSDAGVRLIFRVFVQVRLIDGLSRQVHAQFYRTEIHDEVIKPGIREIAPENPVYFIDLIDKAFRGVVEDLKTKDVSVPIRGQVSANTNAFEIHFDGVSRCSAGQSFLVLRSDGAKDYPELRLIGIGAMQPRAEACTAVPRVANEQFQPGDLVRADYQFRKNPFASSSLLFSARGDSESAPYLEAAVGDLLPIAANSDPWAEVGELFDKPELPYDQAIGCTAVFAFRHDPPQNIDGGVALRSVGTLEWQGYSCALKPQRLGNTVTVQWKNALTEVPYEFYRGQAVRAIAFELVKRAVRDAQLPH